MNRLTIDFSDCLDRKHRAIPIAARALAILGFLVLAAAGVRIVGLWHSMHRVAEEPAYSRTAPTGVTAGMLSCLSESRVQSINRSIGQLNFPWENLFITLERSTPPKVALTAMTLDQSRHRLAGSAQAVSPDAMLAYIATLRTQRFFTLVTLRRHEIDARDPGLPVRFQFEAAWRGSAP